MGNLFYLLNLSVSGIKCIEKEVRLDFYKKTVDKDFDPEKYRVKAIYGENGSGKSAIVTAVKIFRDLIMFENYLKETKTQIFLNEIINKKTQIFRLSCEFIVNASNPRNVYRYSIQLGKGGNGLFEIQQEALEMKNGNYANNNFKVIFESRSGELAQINCADNGKAWIAKKSINLLSSSSLVNIYTANVKELSSEDSRVDRDFLFHILMCSLLVIGLRVYIGEEDQHEFYFLQKRLRESGADNQALTEEIFADGSGLDIFSSVSDKIVDKEYFGKYKEKVDCLTRFIRIFKSDLVAIDIDAKENGDSYVCDLNLNYGDYVINKEFESTGIKKLIRLFDCFSAASNMGIVFVDEMDANLNDVYLCRLIEYFMYYGKGQLCFTTHNLDPMTVLKENRNSIDFLSSDGHLVSWTSRGNALPDNCYRNGMIEDSPFNIDATDFVGIFGE